MGRPASGQQFAPVLRVELDGGVEAAAPGADIDGAGFVAAKQRGELIRLLAQRGGDDVVAFGRCRDRGEFRGVAVAIRLLADAERGQSQPSGS